ncbi:MAG: Rab family GTPase [Candidatus Hodarchaeales archaeon]|jgi:small GTP-binding protein
MTAEYTFKCLVIGPAAVGKSSLVRRFVDNKFDLSYQFTIGVDFLAKVVEFDKDRFAKISIWDVGGQERFRILRRSFYEGTHGALLVFDLSRAKTFSKMKEWLIDMNNIIQKEIPLIILGNKLDLIPDIGDVIDSEEPQQFAKQNNSSFLPTSAKSGDNVEKAFIELTQKMIKHYS